MGVVLYGNDDVDILRQAGLEYDVEIPDLAARDRENARKDLTFAAATSSRACRAASTPTGTCGSTSTR